MTPSEYEIYRQFMTERNRIIESQKDKPATHKTTRVVWHGYERPTGSPLIYSPELNALFLADEIANGKNGFPNTAWFIEPNGDICNLWATDYTEITN